MTALDRRLADLRGEIAEVTPTEARALQQQGAVLVDVREPDETAQGIADGARAPGRGFLELRIEGIAPDPAQPVLVMCGSGVRSLLAAASLRQLGYRDVRSVAGGFNAWKDAGLPFHLPQVLDADARLRYARQLSLPEVGADGQRKLLDARVLLLGAGGLGAPAGLYLAAAGVGTLGIVDHDAVERSNLNRQVIHNDAAVGQPKVESARRALLALNPGIRVHTHAVRLTPDNAAQLFADYDVVIDGSDNFATHYLANDTCVQRGLPCVHGSIYRFEAQVSVFWPAAPGGGPCYRCLYAAPPPPELAPSCNEAGVLGVVPGVVGLLEATEALKIILGIGCPLIGRLLCYDALAMRFRELALRPDPHCMCRAATKTTQVKNHEPSSHPA